MKNVDDDILFMRVTSRLALKRGDATLPLFIFTDGI